MKGCNAAQSLLVGEHACLLGQCIEYILHSYTSRGNMKMAA